MKTNISASFSSEEIFLLKKVEDLEAADARLRHDISRLADALEERGRCRGGDSLFAESSFTSKPKQRNNEGRVGHSASDQITERHYGKILQSMGHAVCVFKRSGEIAYWCRSYGAYELGTKKS